MGKRLEVTLEAFGEVPDIEAEAERLAVHRGCTGAVIHPGG